MPTRKVVPERVEPAPQGSVGSGATAVRPVSVADRVSVNTPPLTSMALVLLTVKRRVPALPGSMGLSMNSLVNSRPLTSKGAEAPFAVVETPPTVAVRSEVTLVYVPGNAPPGTSTGTEKVQLPPGESVPPEKVRLVVPEIDDPTPQTSVKGRPVAARPAITALRSSVKPIFVASAEAAALCSRVNSRVTVPPGATGSSVKSFASRGAPTIVRVSEAVPPVCVTPSTVAEMASVTFR